MEELQHLINYRFNNLALLEQALTHKSLSANNNERLEFLGDSVLGIVIANYLFNNFPQLHEGKLTRLKSTLVRGQTLSEIATELQLGALLKLGTGERKSGGRNNKSTLEDAVEALFGAIFLDSNYQEVEEVILRIYHSRLQHLDVNISFKDNKSKLQELLQKQGIGLPSYTLVEQIGKEHNATFVVEATIKEYQLRTTQRGKSIKKAQQLCAKILLQKLENV